MAKKIESQNTNNGIYDARNKLNDLTGKEWLISTKSFYYSTKCADDKDAFAHPAPFLIKDVERLISTFTKHGMTVFDPFLGSGTTAISSFNLRSHQLYKSFLHVQLPFGCFLIILLSYHLQRWSSIR